MKIRADRSVLADAIAWVSQAVPKRPQAAVLGGMRLSTGEGTLTMQAFDYEVSHTATISVDVIAPGSCLAPAAFLSTFTANMRGEGIELDLDGDDLTIAAGRSTYRTRTMRLQDYPTLPEQAPLVGHVEGSMLADAVTACRKASDDENGPNPILSTIRVHGDEDGLRLTSTNRFVAIDRHLDWEPDGMLAVTPVARMLDAATKGLVGQVRIGATSGLISLATAGRAVTMRLMTEPYPDMDRVIRPAADDDFEAVLDVAELGQAVVRAGKLSDDETPVILDFTETGIDLSIDASERGDGVEQIDCEATGSGTARFAPRYLIDALAAMPAGPVRLGFKAGIKPLVIRPIDSTDRLSLVMPKRGTK